jgi:hypothetical protein
MPQPEGVIFESVRPGVSLKVTAIDSATGVEVSVVLPAATVQADAQRLAVRKLRRRLSVLAGASDDAASDKTTPGDASGGGFCV